MTVLASETAGFTHINQLAALLDQKIASAMNGILAGTQNAAGDVILSPTPQAEVRVAVEGGVSQAGWTSNERQSVKLFANSGTFTLQLGAQTTRQLSVYSSARDVQDALADLAGVGLGNVTVTGDARQWWVEFGGDLAGQNLATLQVAFQGATPSGLVQVSADSLERDNAGVVSGRLVLSQTTYGTFSDFRIAPSAGVTVQSVTAGSGKARLRPWPRYSGCISSTARAAAASPCPASRRTVRPNSPAR